MVMVQGLIVLGVRIVIQRMGLIHLWWIVLSRGVAALANHKPEANARYVFDEDRNVHTIAAIKDIYSGEEIFCDYGDKYQLHGDLAGKHDTLAGHRPPPHGIGKIPTSLQQTLISVYNPDLWELFQLLPPDFQASLANVLE